MTSIKLYSGDNRESLRRLIDEGVQVHSVVTDPPYVMESVIKRFGKSTAAKALPGKDGAFNRSSERFIGKTWDASEIAFDPDFWKLVGEIMLPGAFLFSASGPRSFDRQIAALREAGFIIYPLHAWGFKTGLPKGHPSPRGKGFAFGAGTPKVDFEPLIMAMKPLKAKGFKENIQVYGTGDLNVDACKSEAGKYPSSIIFFPKADKADRAGSKHPTVKPIALMQYMIRHVTPPGGLVLDPFAGSGTTAQAAANEGFDCLLMEAEPEYVEFLDNRFGNTATISYEKDGDDGLGYDLDDSDLDGHSALDLAFDLDDIDIASGDSDDDLLDLGLDEDDASDSIRGNDTSEKSKFDSSDDIEIEDDEEIVID